MTQPQIALIGAGSTVFARNLLGDILSFLKPAGANVRLPGIDRGRPDVTPGVAGRAACAQSCLAATLDRGQALYGADFVISPMQMGGHQPATVPDFKVTRRYGLRQTVAVTHFTRGAFNLLNVLFGALARYSHSDVPVAGEDLPCLPVSADLWGKSHV